MQDSDRKPSPPKSDATMLSIAPAPIFTGTWDHRPMVSSPLSSSPIRASSSPPPKDEYSAPQRLSQSSPIRQPQFRFASRPTRKNPLLRKREEAQEMRRKNFLQNVRQKTDERAWERRDIEGQFLKNSFLADLGRLSYDAPTLSNADLDDAMAFSDQQQHDADATMLDECPDDAEIEAFAAAFRTSQDREEQRPPEPSLLDDEYDDIFAELIAREQTRSPPGSSAEMMDVT